MLQVKSCNRSGNSNVVCTVATAIWTMASLLLSLQGHYHFALKVCQRSLHLGAACVGDAVKTKVSVYVQYVFSLHEYKHRRHMGHIITISLRSFLCMSNPPNDGQIHLVIPSTTLTNLTYHVPLPPLNAHIFSMNFMLVTHPKIIPSHALINIVDI